MGSAKRKTISIHSKNFKTILAINTPTVIPWGQMHARTDAWTDQYFSSIFRDKLSLQGSSYYFHKITHFLCAKRTTLLLLFYVATVIESQIYQAKIFGPDDPKYLGWDVLHLLLEAIFHHSCLNKSFVHCQCSHWRQACCSGANSPSQDHGPQGSVAYCDCSLCQHSTDVGSWKTNWLCGKKWSWNLQARMRSTQQQVTQRWVQHDPWLDHHVRWGFPRDAALKWVESPETKTLPPLPTRMVTPLTSSRIMGKSMRLLLGLPVNVSARPQELTLTR